MIVRSARFVSSSAAYSGERQPSLPEVAMAGRSNVGKSSLINALAGRSKLAKTSAEPGKTRLINYYDLNGEMYLVDLPGYGFAKAPKGERERWGEMIEGYLRSSGQLRHVLQLVDIRHEPTRDDQLMVEYLRHYEIPFTVVATKADKLSRAQQARSIPVICRTLVVQPWEIITTSAEAGTGKESVLELFDRIIGKEEDHGN